MQTALGSHTLACHQGPCSHKSSRSVCLGLRLSAETSTKVWRPRKPFLAGHRRHSRCRTQAPEQIDLQTAQTAQELIGEDAAAFDLSKQSLKSWGVFSVLLTTVLGAMYLVSQMKASRHVVL
eukprot:GHRR01024408.1.p1 GENE.GHRR01024408.1~~GHRR01024408.1.p1  ORF type:complete len:122 (+),score=14.57 GHRR01024408.1:444-809(+)